MARSFWDDDPFNDNMDEIFNRLMNQQNGNSQAKYYVNGHELTPEELAKYQEARTIGQNIPISDNSKNKKGTILEKLGRNLTKEAQQGLLDPVIGRDKEIQETAEVLSRRTKNNPILVGDAGVGKTAVVEGLAQAIVKGDVPEAIKDKQIISIDLSSLEAGTQYRGSFEENIQNLLKEVKKAGNVVLFFDEIHQIIGAGSSGSDSGSKGLADIIKPALSRGEISIIGATTQDEYRNTIMKDAALARRFNDVTINEPSKEATLAILKGLRKAYENHHHVKLSDEVLKAAVDYSVQYIPQRSLPDKAIDLIDMTAAHLAARNPVTDKVSLEKSLKQAEKDKEEAAKKEDYEKAASLKKQIEDLQAKLNKGDENSDEPVAKVNDIAESVQRLTGVPVSQMGANDIEHLKGMGKRLKDKVIGQNEAVDMVVRAIRRNRAGFDDGNRPIGSFLFVGPTGVGKTELVKQLAKDMFGNKNAIVRLDMSEYSDLTAVSKLIGTSAGYVGYEDNGNTLTEKVRRNPYSIVLLDEIEKANPQVLTLLLQVMDDGRLTDGQGNVVDFKNTIIIATSNAGFSDNTDKDKKLMDKLAPYFKPEFLNRFNGIVEFTHLSKDDLNQIVDLMIDDVNTNLAKKNITLKITPEAKEWLIDEGYDEAMGARPLRRVIEQQIRDKVAEYYLDHLDVKNLQADLVDGTIKISEAK
ncbi:ATP-dependent Clp protease ATP-binding subunit [Companilactobacillus bobalius]|uniref:ATP-dependent Clp protease ATP-binding subunit ClpL n=2 Tax=Companilactobacillus bobalius TaxID=2801451 RepID=A0A202F8A2_9LACO|nr:ATP-dependent Clp protease ATP-binding subunit [Companilactobacillus bobalius]GEO58932.1 ATP-dependent Clp protease ATP-binding subunit [Companilactobacillus paralimentarius]KAE9559543.1 ATP-dependent Clp protease ATP-binding subunit [Companilactobacillus bobalius]KAE9564072.1 ATP-dependent Clp protease ATP-binding subunit [Companilactobacillus bobalius]KRK83585.1 ClpL [Companilactobacillus bobalius DSM 19674]OVE96668.1 ATP-dependent Clp protease ATP-binding subunit ClpL [Companilactobacill